MEVGLAWVQMAESIKSFGNVKWKKMKESLWSVFGYLKSMKKGLS